MSSSNKIGLPIAAMLVIASAMAVHAAEIKVSGTVTYVTVSEDSTKLNDGRTVTRLHDKGVVLDKNTASPLHLALQDCFATVIVASDGNFIDGAGYCDTFDKEGNAFWLRWTGTDAASKWEAFHGTGKFEGITGGGTTLTQIRHPDRFNITYDGTLTLK
jgi:hypothetical protein